MSSNFHWETSRINLINKDGFIIGQVKYEPKLGWFWGVGKPYPNSYDSLYYWRFCSLWDKGQNYYDTPQQAQEAAIVRAKKEGYISSL